MGLGAGSMSIGRNGRRWRGREVGVEVGSEDYRMAERI